jgi:hypothetical protein
MNEVPAEKGAAGIASIFGDRFKFANAIKRQKVANVWPENSHLWPLDIFDEFSRRARF